MTTTTWFIVAIGIVLLIAAMIWKMAGSFRRKIALRGQIARSSSPRERDALEERQSEITMQIAFDVLVLMALLWAGVWILQKLSDTLPQSTGEVSLEEIVGWAQRISIVVVAFAILYGLALAVLPKIFPNEGTSQNIWLSRIVAVGLSAAFALPILVSNEMYDRFRLYIEDTFSEVVFNVLGLLALGITVYLVWAKGKVLFRPTQNSRRRLAKKGEP